MQQISKKETEDCKMKADRWGEICAVLVRMDKGGLKGELCAVLVWMDKGGLKHSQSTIHYKCETFLSPSKVTLEMDHRTKFPLMFLRVNLWWPSAWSIASSARIRFCLILLSSEIRMPCLNYSSCLVWLFLQPLNYSSGKSALHGAVYTLGRTHSTCTPF